MSNVPPGVPVDPWGWASWADCQTAYRPVQFQDKEERMSNRPNRVRELREEKGISQEHLARMLGVAPAVLSRVETGEREPTAEQIKELVKLFKLPHVRDLFAAPVEA